jgi:hypothetical protein
MTKLPPAEQEAMVRRWMDELRQREEDRRKAVDERLRALDEAATLARPDPAWRFSREETSSREDRHRQ